MSKSKPAWSTEQQTDYNNVLTLVESFFPDTQKAIVWMATENPMLGGFSPQEMIRTGRTARLVQFIRMAGATSHRKVEEGK